MTAERFDVARDIDPAYDRAYRAALAAGVEAYAFTCRIAEDEVVIDREIPIVTPAAGRSIEPAAKLTRAQ
jgi:sugar fermentation stimulation protein A